ncbi:MAG: hypothetical protein IJH25_15165 [Clostridia bacterium]|nr:hypothetical protein [Clostridia bacterium]
MYTDRDTIEITNKLRKNWAVLTPVLLVILGFYILALRQRVEWLAMVMGPLLFATACFGFIAYIYPNTKYRRFLEELQTGLTREMRGIIVSVSDTPEEQDGAMVLPVHLFLSEEQDERIVYLNVSKADQLPKIGSEVLLRCCGRHIKEAIPT